jgi:hypothetical protein
MSDFSCIFTDPGTKKRETDPDSFYLYHGEIDEEINAYGVAEGSDIFKPSVYSNL